MKKVANGDIGGGGGVTSFLNGPLLHFDKHDIWKNMV